MTPPASNSGLIESLAANRITREVDAVSIAFAGPHHHVGVNIKSANHLAVLTTSGGLMCFHLKHTVAPFALLFGLSVAQGANAASGEMGTAIPKFALYSAPVGNYLRIYGGTNVAIAFPAGCSAIVLTPTTMGLDSYRIAVSMVMAANLSGRRIRFYAHAPRDAGCGVDFVEFQ
jgi:hypothetical protein